MKQPNPAEQLRDSPHGPVAPRPRFWGVTIGGRAPVVALVGNPNTGKTSLFNALTGYRRHVANYPGVTVEVARGPVRGGALQLDLLDLPGTYSLSPTAADESITADVLFGRVSHQQRPDAVLAVVDASNLRRNLFFVTQLLELGLPLVVAVNMMDIALRRGWAVDCDVLARELGCAVVPVIATRPSTIEPLRRAVEDAVKNPMEERSNSTFGEHASQPGDFGANGEALAAQSTAARFEWIDRVLAKALTRTRPVAPTWSERLDEVFTHPWLGLPVLLGVLFVVFQALFTWATPLMEWIEAGFAVLRAWAGGLLPEGALRSLVTDGLIGGVGGVLVFLPQIAMLFALIAILEDCGYLARAAYMLDRAMRVVGLTGRSFIPLLSAFGCAVPAIMGARSIPDRRERFIAILLAPFMSCSARLPVYVLMIAAFVPATRILGGWLGLQGVVMFAMYMVGAVVAMPLAWLLRRTVFAGPAAAFVLELPSYKLPRLRAIAQRAWSASLEFVRRAGTIILLVNLVVWALAYFPRSPRVADAVAADAAQAGWNTEQAEQELEARYLEHSYLGRAGRWIEPVVRPIGWDWRIGVAVLASFPAREVVVGTLGTIFSLGGDTSAESPPLKDALRNAKWPQTDESLFTLPVALSVMVFFALCAQCASTLVVMGRELRSWVWPAISFLSMTMIAYLAALATAGGARFLGI